MRVRGHFQKNFSKAYGFWKLLVSDSPRSTPVACPCARRSGNAPWRDLPTGRRSTVHPPRQPNHPHPCIRRPGSGRAGRRCPLADTRCPGSCGRPEAHSIGRTPSLRTISSTSSWPILDSGESSIDGFKQSRPGCLEPGGGFIIADRIGPCLQGLQGNVRPEITEVWIHADEHFQGRLHQLLRVTLDDCPSCVDA